MPSWLLKAAVQGGISFLPHRDRLNYLLQRHLTGSVVLSEAGFAEKVTQCRRHLERFRQARGDGAPPTAALELGTGWYPIVPLGLALSGVEQVTTIDVSPLLTGERVLRALELYAAALRTGRLWPGAHADRAEIVTNAVQERATADPQRLLARLGVRSLVGDARHSGLAGGSVDLFVSNNTLEHIPPQILDEILAEFRRLAAPEGVMDHFIDMSDHYAHFDPSITEFNYLRYSSRSWRVFNNRLQYQNRLRASDYRRLIERAGFRLVSEELELGAAEALERITLAPCFEHYEREDLLALRGWMTAVVAPAG